MTSTVIQEVSGKNGKQEPADLILFPTLISWPVLPPSCFGFFREPPGISLLSPIPGPLDLLVWLPFLCYLRVVTAGGSLLAAFRASEGRKGVGITHVSVPSFVWGESWQWISAQPRRSRGLGEVACDTVGLRE